MTTYAIDFETYYDKDYSVKTLGAVAYTLHSKFDAYLVSIAGDDEFEWVGHPKDAPWGRLDGHTWISHNAYFDQSVFQRLRMLGVVPDVSPDEWHCTADMCAYLQFPRALAAVCKELYNAKLDKGVRDAQKGKSYNGDLFKPDSELTEYAMDDARWCLRLWRDHDYKWPKHERRLSHLTRMWGMAGVCIDFNRLETDMKELSRLRWESEQQLPWLTDGESVVLSLKHLATECRKAGFEPPPSLALDNEECEAWLEKYGETYPWVGAMRQWRRTNMLLTKYEAIRRRVLTNNRMAYGLKYCGAQHTGRWSGDAGVNMQNLPRGELFGCNLRKCFVPSPGHKFVVADFSQIEPRVLAWLAEDTKLLDEIAKHHDFYEAQARAMGLWEGDEPLRTDPKTRHMVKACLAEGTLILTDGGLIKIEEITTCHRVWDGVSYVQHDGIICHGEREVIDYDGLTATPDHEVYTEGRKSPIPIRDAASKMERIVRSGAGGLPLRVLGGCGQPIRSPSGVSVCDLSVYDLRRQASSELRQFTEGNNNPLRQVFPSVVRPDLATTEDGRSETAVQKSERRELSQLWSSGNHLLLEGRGIWGSVGYEALGTSGVQEIPTGPNRQLQRIRTGESSLGFCYGKQPQQTNLETPERLGFCSVGVAIPEKEGRGSCPCRIQSGTNTQPRTNCRCETIQRVAAVRRLVRVYDIVNAGPNHRFTANGRLVANCNLGLGYGMSWKRFADITGMDTDEAKRLVTLYREKNAPVLNMWSDLERMFKKAGGNEDRTLRLDLPSGRVIHYFNIRRDKGLTGEVVRGKDRKYIWGGFLTENMTQAVAREVMAAALLRVNEIPDCQIVWHVHDEIIAEVPAAIAEAKQQEIEKAMCQPPEWAADLPVAVESSIEEAYTK